MNRERYQVWSINEHAPDFHQRARMVGAPTSLRTAERVADRRNAKANGTRYVVLHQGDTPDGETLGPLPGWDAESLAYVAVHRDDHRRR